MYVCCIISSDVKEQWGECATSLVDYNLTSRSMELLQLLKPDNLLPIAVTRT